MPTTLKLRLYRNSIRDSSIDFRVSSCERVQGMLFGINLTATGTDPDALYKAQQFITDPLLGGCPYWSSLSAAQPNFLLKRIILRGLTPDQAAVELIYETAAFDGPPSSWLYVDDSYAQPYETNMIPGTRQPIVIEWADDAGNTAPTDTVTFMFDRAMRTINISGLIYGGEPPPNVVGASAQSTGGVVVPTGASYNSITSEPGTTSVTTAHVRRKVINTVNSDHWLGYEPGYWRILRFTDAYSRYALYIQRNIVVSTREDEDWSYTGILRNTQTQRFVKVKQSDIDAMNALPYKFGIIYPVAGADGKTPKPGIIRVGPYRTSVFGNLVG